MPGDTVVFRWDFRLVRPRFPSDNILSVVEHLGHTTPIKEVDHALLAVVDLTFEEDIRNTVFSAVTLPSHPVMANTIALLRWPSERMRRMTLGTKPDREFAKSNKVLHHRKKQHALVDTHGKLIGIAIKLEDIPPMEGQ
jgi:hypothetical protein